ncbi:MAG TPA: hypothetical protein VNX47_01075 [Nevskia sp.]|nr:hypothetical protein [Nevskia sp.]
MKKGFSRAKTQSRKERLFTEEAFASRCSLRASLRLCVFARAAFDFAAFPERQ